MASINNLVVMTETEALNAMLGAIGESPVSDIDTATQADVVMAKNILRRTTRDILSEGWRFNTEFGYELAPNGTLALTNRDATTVTINVWEVPTNLIRFDLTESSKQRGLDIVARQPRVYNVVGIKSVFYDRALNRDGLKATDFPFLYINPVWFFDFSFLPESIRALITVISARRLIQEAVGSDTLKSFTQQDEADARRMARKDQGEQDTYNMLNEASVGRALGWPRRYGPTGVSDSRNSSLGL